LTEEVVKLFKFAGIEPTPKHQGETDLEGDPAETAKESNSKISKMKKNSWIQYQEKYYFHSMFILYD